MIYVTNFPVENKTNLRVFMIVKQDEYCVNVHARARAIQKRDHCVMRLRTSKQCSKYIYSE